MSSLRKNVASQVLNFCLVNASTGAALTGATASGKVSGDGTQASASGTFTELGSGQYKYVPTQAETNVTSFGLLVTATSAIPLNIQCFTIGYDPTVANLPANVIQVNGTAQTAKDLGASATQTGDNFTRLGPPAGASVSADIAAVKSDTGTILTDVNTGAGAIYTRIGAPTGASIAADIAAVEANAVGIKSKTDNLAFTADNQVDANILSLNGDGTAAVNLAKADRAVCRGTCTVGGTTTSIPTSAFAPAPNSIGQFIGRTVLFDADTTTQALRGQASNVTASTNSATPTLTVSAMTAAPASGDTFSIV